MGGLRGVRPDNLLLRYYYCCYASLGSRSKHRSTGGCRRALSSSDDNSDGPIWRVNSPSPKPDTITETTSPSPNSAVAHHHPSPPMQGDSDLDLATVNNGTTGSPTTLLPRNIFVLRHGESMGNQDESLFSTMADWKIPLSPKGRSQARHVGRRIQQLIGPTRPVVIYVSPYQRTKETLAQLHLQNPILYTREEPRLREQDFGNFQDPAQIEAAKRERPKFGRFFFRFPHGGESGADVFDRVSAFSGTFLRDMEQLGRQQQQSNVVQDSTAIFVTHGITARCWIMKWFHWSVHEFEELHNPPNCGLLHLVREENGYYKLTEESRRLIRGPNPTETGLGRGLKLGDMLTEQRRKLGSQHRLLTREDRQAFDTLANSAFGM